MGVEMKLAHPKDLRAIATAKIKTDARSSATLAHLLRTGLIPEVYQRSEENRRCQRVLRQRVFYVRELTRVKNRIRVLLAQQEEEIQQQVMRVKNIFSERGKEMLKGVVLVEPDKTLLESLLKSCRHLEARIKESDRLIDRLYRQLREAWLISTVPGFGKFFSVLVATEIADVGRFSTVGTLHCYAGVIPSTYSSGQRSYQGKIIKEGNQWLRWAVVEAVWPAVRADFDLKLHYERLKKRKKSNVAKVIMARRLLAIIYQILREDRPYVTYKREWMRK
jgi:transposase